MNRIETLNNSTDKDMEELLRVWESSVRPTHLFLKENDIESLKPFVMEGIKFVENLVIIRNEQHTIQAFMGVHDKKIEMLFIRDSDRGKGLGKQLINYAISKLNVEFVDVNEQNEQGVGFYKHMGFKVFKRSELDEQGNPFPILHMKV